ncbi:MAG: hypothetical protein PHI97_28930 [Desulfobulbus sp.]|nr:hypothetical protein [Desulfobulbus sp.]
MQFLQRSLFLLACVSSLGLSSADSAGARETIVTGAAGTGYDFRERTYKQEQADNGNEGDTQKIYIGPTITVASKGVYDTLNIQYAPKLGYNFVDDKNEVDQQLNISDARYLTRKWTLTLSDDFVYSDDPESSSSLSRSTTATDSNGQNGSSPQDVLSRDLNGRQYWTNTAGVRTSYALLENTLLGGGYNYSVLRNNSGGNEGGRAYDEYDKHAFFTNLSHGFNPNWRSNLGLNYTRGLYNSADITSGASSSVGTPDLDQYGANIGVDYIRSQHDLYPVKYVLTETQYDGDTRRDTQAHEWSAGWDHAFDPQTRVAVGAGPSYVKTQGLEGTWGYNAYLTFMKQYGHLSYSLQLDKRYEAQNFSGTDASGLTDAYNASANVAYQYTEALGLNLFGKYTRESQIDPQGRYRDAVTGILVESATGDVSYDKDIYQAGLGLKYDFGRWYTAGVKYVYYVSDGQLDSDQYTDHRVLFTLSASKELWRW